MQVRKTKDGKGFYCADCAYEQKDVPKAAGFWFYWGPKKGNHTAKLAEAAGVPPKSWWTMDVSKAALLIEHAADDARPELEAHVKSHELSFAASADIDVPAPEGLTYMPFQLAGVQYALGRQNTLFGDEMGLGKTIQALGFLNALGRTLNVLVVCPATLKLNWRDEAQKWLVNDQQIKVVKNGRDLPADDDNFVIVNYELTFRRNISRRRKTKNQEAETPEDFLKRQKEYAAETFVCDALASRQWDVVVIDEAHFLKNEKAKRSVAIIGQRKSRKNGMQGVPGLVHNADRVLTLTGTPIMNRPIEIFPLLHALYPREFSSYWKFAKAYNGAFQTIVPTPSGPRSVWQMGEAANLDELQRRLRSICMVRRLKVDVLDELPAKLRQIVSIDSGSDSSDDTQEMQAYKRYVEGLIANATNEASARAAVDAYIKVAEDMEEHDIDITKVSKLRVKLAKEKLPFVIDHLNNMIEEGVNKVIVFAVHHAVIDTLMKKFGDRAVKIDGRDSQDARHQSVQRFQNDDSVQFFIGQIHAAGVGLTLTAASHVVFVELDWVPANLTQGEDRAHRIGQKNSVLVQHLVLAGSLDEHFVKMIIDKQAVFDAMLDDEHEAPVLPELVEVTKEDTFVEKPQEELHYEATSDAQREAAKAAMQHLVSLGDRGFSQRDGTIGSRLAELEEPLSDQQVALAMKLVRRYRTRLSAEQLAVFDIG